MKAASAAAVFRLTATLLLGLLLAGAAVRAQDTPGAQGTDVAVVRRIALVIGNNAYASAPLLNPVNDARAMAAALERAGFSVILKTDARQGELLAALRDFGTRLKDGGPGTAGLFYFAGHGMQIRGRNFLVPVGANIEHEDEVSYQSLDAQAVMDKMESAGNGTNIVILDACRNNPFARSFRSGRQGLAQMDAPVGTLVAFSTAPGSVASDGAQGLGNGLYTSHLLSAIQRPGLKVEDVFKQVRAAVLRDSQYRQVPWESSSLVGDFYFKQPADGQAFAAAAPLPAAQPDVMTALDDALWSAVKDSASSAELFAYLNRFPSGRNAREARSRLANLVAPAPLAAAAVSASTLSSPTGLPLPPGAAPEPRDDTASSANDKAIAEAQRRIEEIVRWGDERTDTRKPDARRNAQGFAEGDRYRWRVLDQRTERYVRDYFWRIDRIEPDGSLWINNGAQRLDALGQPRAGNDEVTGLWVDWLPALPLAEALRAPERSELPLATQVQFRDAEGRVTRATLAGTMIGAVPEMLMTEDGLRATRRVELYLQGTAVRSTGERYKLTLNLSWWFVPQMGLPVRMVVEERVDDRLERRHRHDLTASDVLSLPGRSLATAR